MPPGHSPPKTRPRAVLNMSSGKEVFIVGPGFIGWNIIDILVDQGYAVTGLVRRDEHAAGIKTLVSMTRQWLEREEG